MTIRTWLVPNLTVTSAVYRHQRLDEDPAERAAGLAELKARVQAAHDDYRRHYTSLRQNSLDPLEEIQVDDMSSYPGDLPTTTLKGYLGEALAGIIAEDYQPFETQWAVPIYLFRYHDDAFFKLERTEDSNDDDDDDDEEEEEDEEQKTLTDAAEDQKNNIPGRRGDDCLAFSRDADGTITKVLFCEAKCTAGHRRQMIEDGHVKLNEVGPLSILHLIDILRDYSDAASVSWRQSLHHYDLQRREGRSSADRYDLLVYVCGKSPKLTSSWISKTEPHKSYDRRRPLEAIEVHLKQLTQILDNVYDRPSK